jgi:DNA-binding transcriptional regulator YiaG
MPKNYEEWKRNMMNDENPDRAILQSLYDTVFQYKVSGGSSVAEQVLDVAIECTGKYLSEIDGEKIESTTKVGRYTVRDIVRTAGPVKENRDYDLSSGEIERLELRAALSVCLDPNMRGQELKFARKALGFNRSDFGEAIGISEDEIREIEDCNLVIPTMMRKIVFLLIGIELPADQIVTIGPVGFEIDLT